MVWPEYRIDHAHLTLPLALTLTLTPTLTLTLPLPLTLLGAPRGEGDARLDLPPAPAQVAGGTLPSYHPCSFRLACASGARHVT